MKFKEIHAKPEAELRKELAALQEKTRELKFKITSGEHKNVKEFGKVRKTIARIQTSLRQRTK